MSEATENQSTSRTKPLLRSDRRRVDRLQTVSPQLVPLLRNPAGNGALPKSRVRAKRPTADDAKSPTVENQIMDFLVGNKGRPFCDDCLSPQLAHAKRTEIANAIQAIGRAVGFRHVTDTCNGCRRMRAAIKAR